MPVKSTTDHYGSVAVTIHWLSVLLIVAQLGSGFRAADTFDPGSKIQILSIHALLGIAILVLTLARIVWWWFADQKPDPVSGTPVWQDRSARVVHLLFYVVILGMVASGIGMLALSGAGDIVFEGVNRPLPDFWDYKPRIPHGIGARFIVVLFVIHAGAALYHHFVRRDGLLKRMWYGGA